MHEYFPSPHTPNAKYTRTRVVPPLHAYIPIPRCTQRHDPPSLSPNQNRTTHNPTPKAKMRPSMLALASTALLASGASAGIPFSRGSGSGSGPPGSGPPGSVPFVPRGGADAAAGDGPGGGAGSSPLEDMMKAAGVDPEQLDGLMKGMPGGGEGGMPSMEESMKAMGDMMNSPVFKEYMEDPEKLEESRQMILQNPMMKSMMAGMPGFDEILNDPDKWRETMQAAAEMYKQMGSGMGDLMSGMMGGMGGGAGLPGLGGAGGDGMPTLGGSSEALDELSEGED